MVFGNNPKDFGEAVESFLRAKHPVKTAVNVAADTGCTPAQIEKWLEGASIPNGVAVARLIVAYGPEFLSAVLPPAHWITEAARKSEEAALLKQRAEVEKRIHEFYATR